jgi:hypothetical protein
MPPAIHKFVAGGCCLSLRGQAMSLKAMNWCRELKGLSGVDKAVLMYICDRYNENFGYAWPSISRISRDTGWSTATIDRSLRRLERRNYIATYHQFYTFDGATASNRYYLPIMGSLPIPGTIFFLDGDFDHDGSWISYD